MPPPAHREVTWHPDGKTQDIVSAILEADRLNEKQTRDLAPELRGANDMETLRNVWFFVRSNIKYIKDKPGHERIKLPAKTWADRTGDCKSMSVFIAGLLKNLKIRCKYRFTAYTSGPVTHVYVVAMLGRQEIILDAVYPRFNEEEPYHHKKDHMTKISMVHGIGRTYTGTDAPMQVARLTPINWGRLTDGEYHLALVAQQIELLQAWNGDPDGKYRASLDAIYNTLYQGLHTGRRAAVSGLIMPAVARAIERDRHRIRAAGKVYSSVRDPRVSGIGSDYIGMPDEDFNKWIKELIASGKCGDPKEKRFSAWNGQEMEFSPGEWEIRNVSEKKIITSKQYATAIDQCRTQEKVIKVYNEKLIQCGGYHMLYDFVKDANSTTPTVATKTVLHQAGRHIFGPGISGLSDENMHLFLRNSVIATNQGMAYIAKKQGKLPEAKKLGTMQPEDSIKTIIEMHEKGVGDFGATAAIVIGIISAVAALAKVVVDALPSKEKEAAKRIEGFGTDPYSPNSKDWTGYGAKYDKDGKLINDPTKASNSWLLPALAAGGLLFYTTSK